MTASTVSPPPAACIHQGVMWLRRDLAERDLPASVRELVECVAREAGSYAASGDATARPFVGAAAEELLRELDERALLPHARETACRALRVADLVREVQRAVPSGRAGVVR